MALFGVGYPTTADLWVTRGSKVPLARGDAARALKLAAAAAHARQLISAPLPQAEQLKLDQVLLRAWKSLTEPEGRDAWAEGSVMSVEKAIQYSLDEPSSVISGQQGQ